MKALLAAALAIMGLTPIAALAQGRATTADIVGVALDTSSATPVPGAMITAVNVETLLARATTTDAHGRFDLPALPLGRYQVSVTRAGYWPVTLQEMTLALGRPIDLDFRLTASTIREHVSVVGEEAVAPLARAPGATVITQQRIESLPTNGRNYIAFATLAPGVSLDQTPQQGASRTSGLAFAGQRGRSNNVMVDGLDNNDETVGSVRAFFSQEAIREFEVSAGSPSAEFGNAAGGILNVVTKSGGNTLTGNAFGFLRDRALNSRGYFERFTPAGDPIDQSKAPFSQAQFGATAGGPVRKNAAFFFVSAERSMTHASNFVTIDDQTPVRSPLNPALVLGTPADILRGAGFPVETGNVPYTMTLSQFLAKVDGHTAAHTIGGRVSAASELNENIEPFGGQVARSRAAALRSTDVIGAASDTVVLSPHTINELRGQVALRNQLVSSLDPACGASCATEADGGPTLDVVGVASVGRQRFTPSLRDNIRYQVVDSITHYRNDHELRAGIDASYLYGLHQTLPLYFGGRYIFQDISLPLIPNAPPIPLTAIQEVALGLPLAYVQGYGSSGAASNFTDVSLFAQDEWRMRSNVTLNVGLKYQRQFWPSAMYAPAGYPGTYPFPSDRNDVAPRASIAWRPRDSRRTTLDAGYGVYYDNVITSVFGITKYVNGTSDGLRTLVLRAPGAFSAWGAPDHRLAEAAALQLSGGSYPSLAITIDPALKTPYAHHLSAGVERILPAAITLSVQAVYVRGFHQLGTIDYNPIVPALGPGRRPADVGGVAGTSASVLQYTSFGETWYRGLLLSLEKRVRNGSDVLVSYTLSKAEDNSTDFQSAFLPQDNGAGRNPADPNGLPLGFHASAERGASVQDQRHRLVISGTQMLPRSAQLSAIVTVASGYPYTILAGADLNGDGDGGQPSPDRARRVPSDPATSLARNSAVLPMQSTVDVRLSRSFRTPSRVTIDPMFEVFNLFNRSNFITVQNVFGAGAYPSDPNPTFGQFTKAGPARQAQIAVKVGF